MEKLAGIPLSLKLAAARYPVLSAADLAERVKDVEVLKRPASKSRCCTWTATSTTRFVSKVARMSPVTENVDGSLLEQLVALQRNDGRERTTKVELFEQIRPDEEDIETKGASSCVYQAVSELRWKGLATLVRGDGSGYYLDSRVEVIED